MGDVMYARRVDLRRKVCLTYLETSLCGVALGGLRASFSGLATSLAAGLAYALLVRVLVYSKDASRNRVIPEEDSVSRTFSSWHFVFMIFLAFICVVECFAIEYVMRKGRC